MSTEFLCKRSNPKQSTGRGDHWLLPLTICRSYSYQPIQGRHWLSSGIHYGTSLDSFGGMDSRRMHGNLRNAEEVWHRSFASHRFARRNGKKRRRTRREITRRRSVQCPQEGMLIEREKSRTETASEGQGGRKSLRECGPAPGHSRRRDPLGRSWRYRVLGTR